MRAAAPTFALLIALLLKSAAAAAGSNPALTGFPLTGRLEYKITRDGDEIGFQSVDFTRNGDRLGVCTHIRIAVTFLGITIYRFSHEAEEQWIGGQLVSFTSRSDVDGEFRQVALKLEGDRLRGTYNGRLRDYPATLIPASLWHPETVHQHVLLDPFKGRERSVSVVDKGQEGITVRGKPVVAHHYVITDKIPRDIWYDSTGQLVRIRFFAKDGSEILVVPR